MAIAKLFGGCKYSTLFLLLVFVVVPQCLSQVTSYPDQHFIIEGADSLLDGATAISNIVATLDATGIQLVDGAVTGYVMLQPQASPYPFDVGLPSWNGTTPGDNGSFRIFIRVPYGSGWSPWLEVGYWKANLWPGDKTVRFSGGWINIDTVILYSFANRWQFMIEMKRLSTPVTSPTLSLLSFFVSDDRTSKNIDYTAILNDKPEAIFIPTTFLAQYKISSSIGGRICSPTSVAMILLSYDISVDPLQFALDTYDPYYEIFGVWPRVVQNASEYGLRGMVTRYRTWSETREVLGKGGRIAMSIGQPLYSGHLVMLAGFSANGDPIVHDPARTYDGYGKVFNKDQLSRSWFDKGGVAYTFYLMDSLSNVEVPFAEPLQEGCWTEQNLILYPNYPNPFNSSTHFYYELKKEGWVEFKIYNLLGELVVTLEQSNKSPGSYRLSWDGRDAMGLPVSTGNYFYQIRLNAKEVKTGKLSFIR